MIALCRSPVLTTLADPAPVPFARQPIRPVGQEKTSDRWWEILARPRELPIDLLLSQAVTDGRLLDLDLRLLSDALAQVPSKTEDLWSVNLTRHSFASESLWPRLLPILRSWGGAVSRLVFEVQEGPFTGVALRQALRSTLLLRELGAQVALDDVDDVPPLPLAVVDIVKLDPRLLAAPPGSVREHRLHRLLDQARDRHTPIAIVAEAIETPAQLERVAELGIGWWQGHYLDGIPTPWSTS